MKKLRLFLLLISFSSIARSQIHFGVKAGLNLTNIRSDSSINTSYISNFNIGVLVSIPITKSLSLQPDLMYSGQGYGGKYKDTSFRVPYGYLVLPVLLKYSLSQGAFAETGPQFGLLVKKLWWLKSSEFSWVFGIGYKMPMNLGFDVRYTLGITGIGTQYFSPKSYNSVFQFDVFYFFGK